MNPHDIKAELGKAGIGQADIARHLKISKVMVGHVVYGRGRSSRVERLIARIIHRPPAEVWPQWYVTKGRTRAK